MILGGMDHDQSYKAVLDCTGDDYWGCGVGMMLVDDRLGGREVDGFVPDETRYNS
jgi:hypothetical protein